MFSSPELITPKRKLEKKERQESLPETEDIKLKKELIRKELMHRSMLAPAAWKERYDHAFRQLFIHPENQQLFWDLYENEPEALYGLLDKILSGNN